MAKSGVKEFLKQKSVDITVQTYLIDVLGAMAFGLFASLLIGTIFGTLSQRFQMGIFNVIADYAKSITGVTLGIAIAYALKAPRLVLFSAATVGIVGNILGGPVGALVTTIIVVELGKIVSKRARLDIIVTPDITTISGMLVAQFVGLSMIGFMNRLGNLVKTAMEMQPLIMGILVSAPIGIILALSTSSAAVRIALSLDGLVGGAAIAGCCTQIIGFAVMSYRENKVGRLMVQDLGASMLQMGNIVLSPRVRVPPTLASVITGSIAIMVFRLEGIPVGSGVDTCGLVGPIGVYTAMNGGTSMQVGILLVRFLLPVALTLVSGEVLRRMRWIKDGDLKLGL